MKNRCDNPKQKDYKYYKERGIIYDDKWKTFEGFLEDMGQSYKKGLTIDRIDNNKNYTKDNCRWITMVEQQSNRRNNRFIIYNNKKQTVSQWSRETGISVNTLTRRLNRKLSIEEIFRR